MISRALGTGVALRVEAGVFRVDFDVVDEPLGPRFPTVAIALVSLAPCARPTAARPAAEASLAALTVRRERPLELTR